MKKEMIKSFDNPGSKYRGAPFWAWNGKLDPTELRRQIRIMHRMGLGGFFMHSRVGLDTAYLSDEWFKCVDACIDEAEKLDMQAWLYDEDRWPSGAAGGLVTQNPKYRRRSLVMETISSVSSFEWTTNTVAVFTARLNDNTVSDINRITKSKVPPKLQKDISILAFSVKIDNCEDWYNGQTYLDTLNDEAVRNFIAVTHESYAKKVGEHFGKRVPGIFTDEPNYGNAIASPLDAPGSLPWTGRLPSIFKSRYGYDIRNHLPELFFDLKGQKVSQKRYHYYDCITHLFVDAFSRQIGEWCDKNKMQHTGHVLAEETLSSQTSVVGSAMRFYEYMQAPGIDNLTEHEREYDTAKQCSSVARQFGRKWRLTETYGCSGWDFPFAGHKAVSDWQVALGINLRCQHLAWYTMEGEAKRDYPASISYQAPWSDVYSKVEDYFARVHIAMTQGTEIRDLLVIHPVESMWTMFNRDITANQHISEYNKMLIDLRDTLLGANIDFDYGDEDIMQRHGKVSCKNDLPTLSIGKATYKLVLVPPLLTMRESTLRFLKRFRSAGGTVVFAGDVADHVDALPSDAVKEFAADCIRSSGKGKGLVRAVEEKARRISIADAEGQEIPPALHLLREDKDAFYLFVCNTGHTKGQLKPDNADMSMVRDRKAAFSDVRIRGFAGCAETVTELDPQTGKTFAAKAKQTDDGIEIATSLPALGSRIFVVPKKRSRKQLPQRQEFKTIRNTDLTGIWNIFLSENNCLVLDTPRCKIGNSGWRKKNNILHLDYAVRDALGIPRRGGQMVQPWARVKNKNPKKTTVKLEYIFDVKTMPSGDLFLGIERPDTFTIVLNGSSVETDAESGWWCDRSLRKIPLNVSLLKKGTNKLLLTCDYTEDHPGLEIVYLLGSFGVNLKTTETSLVSLPAKLKIGDWCKQSLPFYAGSVTYTRTIRPKLSKKQHLFVNVPEYRGMALRVLVNEKSAGIIAWEPNEVDITDLIPGDGTPVDLRIEVLGHRRNSHGPLHLNERWPRWTGPHEFVTADERWQDTYNLVPCGLMASPKLIVKKHS